MKMIIQRFAVGVCIVLATSVAFAGYRREN